jgi:hypothetical protein
MLIIIMDICDGLVQTNCVMSPVQPVLLVLWPMSVQCRPGLAGCQGNEGNHAACHVLSSLMVG